MKIKPEQVWRIEWVDSQTGSAGWVLASAIEPPELLMIKTYGFIVKETKSVISIAQNSGNDGGQYSHIINIPAVAIVRRSKVCLD